MGKKTVLGGLFLLAGSLPAQQPGVDVWQYVFWVDLPDTGSVIHGFTQVLMGRTPAAGDTVRLDLVGLTVDSVREPPQRHLEYGYDGNTLRVAFGPRRAPVEEIQVFYHGAPRDGLIFGTNAHQAPTAFGDNWPERARYWVPTVDAPADKATVSWVISSPVGPRSVVANGVLRGCEAATATRRVCRWTEGHPIPAYTMVLGFALFSVSHHRPVVHGTDTIPIDVWSYPEDSAYADSVPFRRATEIVETMERLVAPFPYEKLAHVESSTRYGGMENSTAIFYAERPYVARRMREGVVRHETSHQWFGDAVTERSWPHLWLSEGFASYFDLVIGAALDGDSVLTAGLRRDAATYFASKVVDRPLVDTAQHDPNQLLNENSYQKGAWVLHMLRGSLGDSGFFQGIREYYRTYRDSTATSEDFEGVMERVTQRDLQSFFTQWLWQPGYPQLHVVWRYDAAAHRLRLDLTQVQAAAWGVFRLPRLVIEVPSQDGKVTRRVFSMDGRSSVAYLEMATPPTAIRVDPDGRLLLTATVEKGVP
jgi:aminopeptidase N